MLPPLEAGVNRCRGSGLGSRDPSTQTSSVLRLSPLLSSDSALCVRQKAPLVGTHSVQHGPCTFSEPAATLGTAVTGGCLTCSLLLLQLGRLPVTAALADGRRHRGCKCHLGWGGSPRNTARTRCARNGKSPSHSQGRQVPGPVCGPAVLSMGCGTGGRPLSPSWLPHLRRDWQSC